MNLQHFLRRGWVKFAYDPVLFDWVEAARPVADRIETDPEVRAEWLRCGGTWFAGVNVFPNDAAGAVPAEGVSPIRGRAVKFIEDALELRNFDWDAAQISVCYPGYPQPWDGESDSAFRYRRDRDAAHVDGLRRSDPGRRRHPSETHGFILGIPLNAAEPEASPLVVWEGSHEIIRAAFVERLADIDPARWREEDVTETYVAARRRVFDSCTRVAIHARLGECYLVHRLALHGVAKWKANRRGSAKRSIAYFRPGPHPGASPDWWLEQP